jgi:hypothetical protein
MSLLWDRYVFRRGLKVVDLWDDVFRFRKAAPLFVAGCGFDVRVRTVLERFLESARIGKYQFQDPILLLIEYSGYELDSALQQQTEENCAALRTLFEPVGQVITMPLQLTGDEEHRATGALRDAASTLVKHLSGRSDVLLDVSSLPRVVYLALMTSVLGRLIPDVSAPSARVAGGVTFQVLVAEDAALDSAIQSEDPSENLVTIPGFGGGFNVESMSEWPVVWFPMLGEGRTNQFEKVRQHAPIPEDAEICPVLPHPSRNPRRGDMLLLEYRQHLFDVRAIPTSNIVFAHESNPFEAYRQLRNTLGHYKRSLEPLGGSRLLVTPLASKLMTVACGLACFEMRPPEGRDDYAIGIPYAAPTRYVSSIDDLKTSKPEISALLLTGEAYATVERRTA